MCKFANVLKAKGVGKGDCVAIYLPMIVELPVAMLACARIGAIHSVVFGGFSSEALAERVIDGALPTHYDYLHTMTTCTRRPHSPPATLGSCRSLASSGVFRDKMMVCQSLVRRSIPCAAAHTKPASALHHQLFWQAPPNW